MKTRLDEQGAVPFVVLGLVAAFLLWAGRRLSEPS